MKQKDDTTTGYNLDKAIKAMNESVSNKEVIDIVPVKEVKKAGRPKLIDKAMEKRLIKLAEELFFIRSIAGEAGISVDTIERELRGRSDENREFNEEFALSFVYAQNKFIAYHQRLMMKYAKDKKTKDWRAEAHILTLCDKEFSERKYLTEAVANQDAKILMLIKAEQLTIATKEGKGMLEKVINTPSQGEEEVSLLPFKPEDPKNKGKAKKTKNTHQNGTPPPVR